MKRRAVPVAAQHFDAPYFVFIDADHTYSNVKRDIEAWRKAMQGVRNKPVSGATLAGHDYYFGGVCKAVQEVLGDVEIVPTICTGSWRKVF